MISTDTSTATGVLTSSTQTIALGFYFMANTDLVVTRTRSGVITTLTLDSDYSVTGANNESGGSITVTGQASGDVITIVRTVQYTQLVDLVPLARLSETLLERSLDKLTMLCQQLKRSVDASGLLPTRIASTSLGADGSGNWVQRSASDLFTFLKTYGGFFGTTSGTVAAGDDARIVAGGTAVQPGDLDSAAYTASTDYATAAQGALADTAVQPGDLGNSATKDVGTTSGTVAAGDDARIVAGGTAVQPGALGTAASHAATDFATSAQGALADTALQPTGNGSGLTGLTKTQVGLPNCDNTSDVDKPVSTAQASAIATGDSVLTPNSTSDAYTLVLTDAGKCLVHPAADTTARAWTIPANASVAFTVGTTISIANVYGAGAITLSITTDAMYLAGSSVTGSRTISSGGLATLIKVASTTWMISGAGVS